MFASHVYKYRLIERCALLYSKFEKKKKKGNKWKERGREGETTDN